MNSSRLPGYPQISAIFRKRATRAPIGLTGRNLSRMNTYAKCAANPCGMRTSKIIGLKASCNEHLQKMGVGKVLLLPTALQGSPSCGSTSLHLRQSHPRRPNRPRRASAGAKMSDDKMTLDIRAATERDVPLILSFIRKLAEYGDISDEVAATEGDIRAALFGPHPVAATVLAYVGRRARGIRPLLLHVFQFSRPPGHVCRGPLRRERASQQRSRQSAAWSTSPNSRSSVPAAGWNGPC